MMTNTSYSGLMPLHSGTRQQDSSPAHRFEIKKENKIWYVNWNPLRIPSFSLTSNTGDAITAAQKQS